MLCFLIPFSPANRNSSDPKGMIEVLLNLSDLTHVSIFFFLTKSTIETTPPFPLNAIRPSLSTTALVKLFLVPIFKSSNTKTLQSPSKYPDS